MHQIKSSSPTELCTKYMLVCSWTYRVYMYKLPVRCSKYIQTSIFQRCFPSATTVLGWGHMFHAPTWSILSQSAMVSTSAPHLKHMNFVGSGSQWSYQTMSEYWSAPLAALSLFFLLWKKCMKMHESDQIKFIHESTSWKLGTFPARFALWSDLTLVSFNLIARAHLFVVISAIS